MNRPDSSNPRRIEVEGRSLVVKTATGNRRALLRQEAEVLQSLSGPGVVSFVALREGDDTTHLVLDDAGEHDLAAAGSAGMGHAELLRALRDTARVVAALHERGWVHGALCAEHVVVRTGASGVAVTLCSWGSARPTDSPDARAADVADLVALVAGVLRAAARYRAVSAGHGLEGVSRWRRVRRLLAAVEQAAGGQNEGLASARAVAAALDGALDADGSTRARHASRSVPTEPGARSSRRSTAPRAWLPSLPFALPFSRPSSWPSLRRCGAAVVVAVGLAALGVGALGALNISDTVVGPSNSATTDDGQTPLGTNDLGDGPPADEAVARPLTPSRHAETPTTSTAPDPEQHSSGCSSGASSGGAVIDLDGDGCRGPILIDGPFVQADGIEFEIGTAGDVSVAGDWDCSGTPRIRLLRPSTGEIYEFSGWTTSSEPIPARLIALAPGARTITAHDEADCDRMVLADSAGDVVAPTELPDRH